jgi:hypothetical protein
MECSVVAAGAIAVSNALSAMLTFSGGRPVHTLANSDPKVLAGIQVSAALLAAYLAVRTGRKPSLGLASVILAWSIVEALPWVTLYVYGHGFGGHKFGAIMYMVVASATLGVRGALAQRKLSAALPQSG